MMNREQVDGPTGTSTDRGRPALDQGLPRGLTRVDTHRRRPGGGELPVDHGCRPVRLLDSASDHVLSVATLASAGPRRPRLIRAVTRSWAGAVELLALLGGSHRAARSR